MKHVEQAAERGQTPSSLTCVFCRTTLPISDEEKLAQLSKRVELKDPKALLNMAWHYGNGELGLPVDHAKCLKLLREAVDLGCPDSQYQLGCFHDAGAMGLEQNEGKALKYWAKAAEKGDIDAHHNLGAKEGMNRNDVASMRHYRFSASGGYRLSMKGLIACFFEGGLLHHGDLAETLQAFYRARAEMRSEDRDQYIEYLRMKGEDVEEYEY
jgi:TPR repeat protein